MMTFSRTLSISLLSLALSSFAPQAHAEVSQDYVNILDGRISALEDQMRGLVAQVEQTAHQSQVTAEKLDRLQTDIDTRFRMLQDSQMAATSSPAASAPAETPPQVKKPAKDAQSDLNEGVAPPDTDQKTLGELVEEASSTDGSGAPETTSAKNAANDPNAAYENAFSLVRDGDYDAAEKAMRAFLKKWPKNDLASNAAYWLGETYYVRGDYNNAAKSFADGYQKYPKGAKSEDVLLKLGMSLSALGRPKDACLAYDQLKGDFPKMSAATRDRLKKEETASGCAAAAASSSSTQPQASSKKKH